MHRVAMQQHSLAFCHVNLPHGSLCSYTIARYSPYAAVHGFSSCCYMFIYRRGLVRDHSWSDYLGSLFSEHQGQSRLPPLVSQIPRLFG